MEEEHREEETHTNVKWFPHIRRVRGNGNTRQACAHTFILGRAPRQEEMEKKWGQGKSSITWQLCEVVPCTLTLPMGTRGDSRCIVHMIYTHAERDSTGRRREILLHVSYWLCLVNRVGQLRLQKTEFTLLRWKCKWRGSKFLKIWKVKSSWMAADCWRVFLSHGRAPLGMFTWKPLWNKNTTHSIFISLSGLASLRCSLLVLAHRFPPFLSALRFRWGWPSPASRGHSGDPILARQSLNPSLGIRFHPARLAGTLGKEVSFYRGC